MSVTGKEDGHGCWICCHWNARLGGLHMGELHAQAREVGNPHEIRLESRIRGTATHVQLVRNGGSVSRSVAPLVACRSRCLHTLALELAVAFASGSGSWVRALVRSLRHAFADVSLSFFFRLLIQSVLIAKEILPAAPGPRARQPVRPLRGSRRTPRSSSQVQVLFQFQRLSTRASSRCSPGLLWNPS